MVEKGVTDIERQNCENSSEGIPKSNMEKTGRTEPVMYDVV